MSAENVSDRGPSYTHQSTAGGREMESIKKATHHTFPPLLLAKKLWKNACASSDVRKNGIATTSATKNMRHQNGTHHADFLLFIVAVVERLLVQLAFQAILLLRGGEQPIADEVEQVAAAGPRHREVDAAVAAARARLETLQQSTCAPFDAWDGHLKQKRARE